jgi:hypothetical protein
MSQALLSRFRHPCLGFVVTTNSNTGKSYSANCFLNVFLSQCSAPFPEHPLQSTATKSLLQLSQDKHLQYTSNEASMTPPPPPPEAAKSHKPVGSAKKILIKKKSASNQEKSKLKTMGKQSTNKASLSATTKNSTSKTNNNNNVYQVATKSPSIAATVP